jgi:hypothetical protein
MCDWERISAHARNSRQAVHYLRGFIRITARTLFLGGAMPHIRHFLVLDLPDVVDTKVGAVVTVANVIQGEMAAYPVDRIPLVSVQDHASEVVRLFPVPGAGGREGSRPQQQEQQQSRWRKYVGLFPNLLSLFEGEASWNEAPFLARLPGHIAR